MLDPAGSLAEVVAAGQVTHLTVPPSVLATVEALSVLATVEAPSVLATVEDGLPDSVPTVVVAGEACPPGLAAQVGAELPGDQRVWAD